jgi:apolipoprotein N-acyltransferase
VPIALCLTLHLIGFGLYSQPLGETPASALKVGIIQGNIPTRIKLFEAGTQLALDRYTQGYQALADQNVDVVVTPEGAFPWLWVGRPRQSENPFYQAILDRGIPAWIGTVGMRAGRVTQTLFSVSGTGSILGRYDKIKLVPLGEYIPFEEFLGKFIDRLSPSGASMLPGAFDQHFDTPFGRAIAAICYESAFPWLFRNQAAAGGQFIITASNNDPYNATMMAQHHAQDVMRSIESDRWAVRATNTGFSGIVDPHGKTQWISGFRTYETHAHTIHRRQTRTLYVRWGDWLLPLLGAIALMSLAIERRRPRR